MEDSLDILPLKKWGLPQTERPLVIAGPCGAESEEQVLKTAGQLKKAGISIFRAGIWKPRTRPGAFEGVGAIGLKWMKRVQDELGMLTTTEVANAKHAELAMKSGVDILWLGARTTANPFAVQEIASALKGADIPTLIKNPVNPDMELWLGAIERLNKAGIKKLAAIHRGFSSYKASVYRNTPRWQIPIDIQQAAKGIPMICDPSHMAGKRDFIKPLSQKAMDLNYDGLMIEAHENPAQAKTDAEQQITPAALKKILDELAIRRADELRVSPTLHDLRERIEKLDADLINVLRARMETVKDIGHYKKRNNITIFQPSRWLEVLNKTHITAEKTDVNVQFIKNIFKVIHQESINIQTQIMNE